MFTVYLHRICFTLGPAYNDFGYNEHPTVTIGFLYIEIIDSSFKKFGYNEHPFRTKSYFCIFLAKLSLSALLM